MYYIVCVHAKRVKPSVKVRHIINTHVLAVLFRGFGGWGLSGFILYKT